MRRFALILAATMFSAVATAGADSDNSKTFQSTDGQYQLVLTKDWQTTDFHNVAVQISAVDKHTGEYVELIAEDRQTYVDSLEQYAEAKRDTMALSLDNPRLTAAAHLNINGLDAVRYEIHGQLPNSSVTIGYLLTVIRTKTHYIQIIGFAQESHFSENAGDLGSLAGGFSETADAAK
jgi:hypothetical protein